MNKCVEILKNGGFYSVFGDSAYILHFLFNYKIVDGRVGFPLSVHDKVIAKLDELCISYNDSVNNSCMDFKRRNRYDDFVLKGKKKFSFNFRINCIISKLECLSEEKLDEILNYIEKSICNE